MEYRQGKCAGCGAEYKIPASFQHDAAKCKECGGVVHIAPSQSARARPAATPIPARKFAGKREEQPEVAAAEQPSALARMKTERAALEGGSTLERLKHERAAAPPPPPAPATPPAAPRPAAERPAATAAPAPKADAPRTKEPAGAGARAGRRPPQKKKPSLALRAVALVCLLGAGVGGYLYVTRGGDDAPAADEATPAQAEPVAPEGAEPPAGPAGGEEPPVDKR